MTAKVDNASGGYRQYSGHPAAPDWLAKVDQVRRRGEGKAGRDPSAPTVNRRQQPDLGRADLRRRSVRLHDLMGIKLLTEAVI
jgi:hypothetical protein